MDERRVLKTYLLVMIVHQIKKKIRICWSHLKVRRKRRWQKQMGCLYLVATIWTMSQRCPTHLFTNQTNGGVDLSNGWGEFKSSGTVFVLVSNFFLKVLRWRWLRGWLHFCLNFPNFVFSNAFSNCICLYSSLCQLVKYLYFNDNKWIKLINI